MKYGMRERVSGIVIVIALLIIFIPLLISEPETSDSQPQPELRVERPVDVPRRSLEDPAPPPRLEISPRPSGADQARQAQPEPPVLPGLPGEEAANQEQAAADASQGTEQPADDPIARLAREVEQRQVATGDGSADSGSASNGAASGRAAIAPVPGGEWAVQVGSFGKPDNASGLEKRLNEKGYPAYQRKRDNNLTSVYVGPFATSEAAESVMAELKAELNQQGLLVRTDG
ncbi:MAG TPA: SPOR domain-containing protein [Halomonas sp.]|nr:SPOR domain-containing protein [Halomonas sp.]